MAVLKKIRCVLTVASNFTPWYLPREIKMCPHKGLYMNVYTNFTYNSQNLETTQC